MGAVQLKCQLDRAVGNRATDVGHPAPVDEWQIAYDPLSDADPDTANWQFQPSALNIDTLDYANTERHASSETAEAVWLRPLLADRALVSRPVTPLYVPAGETVIIFVRSSLWLRIEAGDSLIPLQELPILRPSDTWFGLTTMEGEFVTPARPTPASTLRICLLGRIMPSLR